ncbi:MAG: DUF424 family protein [Candidatus Thermoplasmatota archaeon]
MLRIKVHRAEGEVVVAACDAELIGREFQEGRMRLKVTELFYGDDEYPETALDAFLSTCTTANLCGERAVKHAVSRGYIEDDHVLSIQGVKYALLVVMEC